jgi:hypothetical protein
MCPSTEATMTTETAAETQWLEDVDKALGESKKSGRALLLDFTAAPM